jgi:hypothetical protein
MSAASPTHAQPADTLADGTSAMEWSLANGLHVVVRDVPGVPHVAIVVAYPVGWDDDPSGREGLAELAAEAAFRAEAGDVPGRTSEELDRLRPVGWNVRVERRRTELGEMTTAQQFPGVLRQTAQRVRGVRVSDAVLAQAFARTAERRARLAEDVAVRLYGHLGELAGGRSDETIARHRDGSGVRGIKAKDLQKRIDETYAAGGAVLSLAGDFKGLNLRALVENEFGGIPAGKPFTRDPGHAAPRTRVRQGASLRHTLAGIGIVAPAIDDTLHPSFFLSMLMLGTYSGTTWGRATHPLTSRFQFAVLDDPTLARFYPPVHTAGWTPEQVEGQFVQLATGFRSSEVPLEPVVTVQRSLEWLLGGPLTRQLHERLATDTAVLYNVCSTGAARRLVGDASFWAEYRRRFDPRVGPSFQHWYPYMVDASHQVSLVYEPSP